MYKEEKITAKLAVILECKESVLKLTAKYTCKHFFRRYKQEWLQSQIVFEEKFACTHIANKFGWISSGPIPPSVKLFKNSCLPWIVLIIFCDKFLIYRKTKTNIYIFFYLSFYIPFVVMLRYLLSCFGKAKKSHF